jgi:hypothetical protein
MSQYISRSSWPCSTEAPWKRGPFLIDLSDVELHAGEDEDKRSQDVLESMEK